MPAVAPREAARRMTHAGVGLLSLTLRVLPWEGAVLCCVAGIVGNLWVLPRAAPKIFRPDEGTFAGVRAYPMAVLCLVILFPLRIAAGAWAILAVGDSMAALVGRSWGTRKLPWNRDKSWQGLLAFVGFGAVAGAIALDFVSARPDPAFGLFSEVRRFFVGLDGQASPLAAPEVFPSLWRTLGASAAASLAGGIAETLRARLDDNFRVALAAGAVLSTLDPLVGTVLVGRSG